MHKNGKIILKSVSPTLLPFFMAVFFICFLSFRSQAQNIPDSAKIKDAPVKNDTTSAKKDSSTAGSRTALEQKLGIRISKDALPGKVVATATDSAVMDMQTNDFRLYGDAKVDYEDKKLSADRIDFNQASNVATAMELKDTATQKGTAPTFTQGNEKFTYDHLQYNFRSQRAIVRNARSQYGEGYVNSRQIKRNSDQSLYGYKNVYTTCALPEPHFGIRANKIKIVPGQAIATGSANIEIEGVPTPLFLPFGYFPVSQSHRSGFLLPGYTIEQRRGIGFTKGGYYFSLNDYVDLQLQADIYTKGSYTGYLNSNYFNKYHYSGNVFASYASNKTGEEFDPLAQIQKDFAFRWTHQKDPKSLPGISFNAFVNIQSGSYYQNNSINANQIVQNQYNSNVSFTKNWDGSPFSLTASATHNQNIVTGEVKMNLPNVTLYMMPRTPFQRKNMVGQPKWYEKITVGYTVNGQNEITFYDSTLNISRIGLSDFRNGVRHSVPITANYNMFRYVTMTFSAAYNEFWNTESTNYRYNNALRQLDTARNRGFYTSRDFNAGVEFNTAIYGMLLFKKGKIRGFRHVIRPNTGISFRPDFALDPFNYYYRTSMDSTGKQSYQSPYSGSIIGGPRTGKEGMVKLGVNNRLEMKVRSSKDSTGFKNIVLLDGFDIGTYYNLAVDSFQWQPVTMQARTNILNRFNVSASAEFDPYAYDYLNGRRSTRTAQAAGKGLARLSRMNVSGGATLNSTKASKAAPVVNSGDEDDFSRLMRNNGYAGYVDFNVPWNLGLTYTLSLSRNPSRELMRDTTQIDQAITISGDVNLTSRWKLMVNTGYNIKQKQITMSQINIIRDLHCWEMNLSLIPFGTNKRFDFTLNVKAQVLHDLKLTRRKDYRDGIQY